MSTPPLIAVVDDDPRVLDSIENLLESAGHRVQTFPSAQALLSSGQLPSVALLVSDIAMPDIDGFELQRQVRALQPDTPVLFMTGHELSGDAKRRAGPTCLRKPFEGSLLLAMLERLLPGLAP